MSSVVPVAAVSMMRTVSMVSIVFEFVSAGFADRIVRRTTNMVLLLFS